MSDNMFSQSLGPCVKYACAEKSGDIGVEARRGEREERGERP